MTGLIIDLFAGGGGASTGIEAALGRSVDIAINHSPVALAVHEANHPGTRHLTADIWEVKPREATGGRHVDLLWASPDCTHFSIAKGGKPRKQNIRSLAWAVVRWANDVRPDVIALENVAEFKGWGPLDRDGKPVKTRMGQTFLRWKRSLERLGYVVDFRILDASQFGAPTRRRRLFLVARCDGQRIVWPQPTHGPGLIPFRTAADCIDWSLPCPSIFERKKPLAEKTLWRIAQGIKRFVIENPNPFIVKFQGPSLMAPTLVQTGYGEREGQAARSPEITKPLGTVVAGGQKHAAVAAFLSKAYSEQPGKWVGAGSQGLDQPAPTFTTQDHSNLAAVTLATFRGTAGQKPAAAVDEPLHTVSAGGLHVAEVRAFLLKYYGTEQDPRLDRPLGTVTTRDRFGLVTVGGVDYQIADIGMRMLEPHELLAAQFGRFASEYDLSQARTKAAKVSLIGNSVCPEVAEALIRANFEAAEEMAA